MTTTLAPPVTSWLDGIIQRIRDDDAARPRSVQAAVGWSELGGCRSALGFRLDGAWASDETDNWAAIRGSGLHAYLEQILAGPGVSTEVDTIYRGVPGHADLVGPDWVADLKTKTLASARIWEQQPDTMRAAWIQVNGYAAGLVDAGDLPPDCVVRILVAPVDGTFADWRCYERPFSRALADEGIARLEQVRDLTAAGERLPKDMPYQWCSRYCSFFSLCRDPGVPDGEEITDPEHVAAIAAYGDITQQVTRLYKEKDGLAEMIRGLRGTAGDWRVGLSKPGDPKPALDEGAVWADYEARGEKPPMTTKPGAAPRLSVTRVKKAKP